MDNQILIDQLEHHFKQTEGQASDIYKLRLRRTIDRLKSGYYLSNEEKLIVDLESLGFVDLGRQIRKGMYI